MNVLEAAKLAFRLGKLSDEVKREGKMGFSWSVAFKKAGYEFGKSLLGMVGAAAVAMFTNDAAVSAVLTNAGFSTVLVGALVPLIHSGAELLQNWYKHGDKVTVPDVQS